LFDNAAIVGAVLAGSYEPLDLERVTWGESLAVAARAEIARRHAERPLIVVSPSCRRATNVLDQLLSALPEPPAAVFDEISPHVGRASVVALIGLARATKADLIVTIGGGSTIDTVKVALLGLGAGIRVEADLDALCVQTTEDGLRLAPSSPPPPFRQVVAPTTLSGAEFSDLAGCTDEATNVKQLFTGRRIGSASVILDPTITLGTPLDIWLSTGVRALDHAVETLCSAASNPWADALCAKAIPALADSLRRTRADHGDLQARGDGQIAVWLACAGLNRVPWGASHGVGHQLGAVAKIPHGFCSCILLPHVLAYNAAVNAERQALVAAALGAEGRPAAQAIADLVAELGLPTRLRDVGVTPQMLPVIAATSLANLFVRQNPRPIRTEDDVMEILEAAF
jgi:alcohol dehydrogenase class IV